MTSAKLSDDPVGKEERQKLLRRVGIAVVLIALLIGALALFERHTKKIESGGTNDVVQPGPSISVPGTEAEKKPPNPAEASGTIALPPADQLGRESPPAEPESSALPEDKRIQPAQPAAQKPAAAGAPRLIVGQGSGTEPAAKPSAESPAPAAAAPKADYRAPPTVATPNGYVVQVGVFANLNRAEDLRQKLADAGIPARIEAHVQVGPFKTREEAAAAQQQLRGLGMDPGLVIAPRK